MLQIGITGGIGSGKSLVCSIFEQLGISVYYADDVAKEMMGSNVALVRQIKQLFGTESYFADGSLNRNYLSSQIFHDQEKKEKIESFVHPVVAQHYQEWLKRHTQSPYVLKEAALIFEMNTHRLLNKVITVYAPLALRLRRVMARDPQRKKAQIQAIMAKQMPEEQKIKQADFIIKNDERQLVIPQITSLDKEFNFMLHQAENKK